MYCVSLINYYVNGSLSNFQISLLHFFKIFREINFCPNSSFIHGVNWFHKIFYYKWVRVNFSFFHTVSHLLFCLKKMCLLSPSSLRPFCKSLRDRRRKNANRRKLLSISRKLEFHEWILENLCNCTIQNFTVWHFMDISVTQILHEISFGENRSSKTLIYCNFRCSEFC